MMLKAELITFTPLRPEVLKLWGTPPPHPVSADGHLGEGGGQVDCMRDIFISNEIWVQS
jgi:hypothetical protein